CSSKGRLRPDHWMILIVRLERALIAMPRRHARQVQQTVQQTRNTTRINRCIFNRLRRWLRRALPPYGAPLSVDIIEVFRLLIAGRSAQVATKGATNRGRPRLRARTPLT